MNSIVQCLLWCLFLGFNPILAEGNLEDVNESVQQKISGGYKVREGALPYQCYLRAKGIAHFGGGCIISQNYVLSAAHNFDIVKNGTVNSVEVVAGVVNIHDSANMVVRDIKRFYVHENYTPKKKLNDIALIQVNKPFTFSKTLAPIALNTKPVKEGTKCIVSGWGLTSRLSIEGSVDLMAAMVPMMSHKQCTVMLSKQYNPNSMICAGFKQGMIGSCIGDSGGPLACENHLVGIVSWGCERCETPNRPDVYVDVSKFIDWINGHIAQNY